MIPEPTPRAGAGLLLAAMLVGLAATGCGGESAEGRSGETPKAIEPRFELEISGIGRTPGAAVARDDGTGFVIAGRRDLDIEGETIRGSYLLGIDLAGEVQWERAGVEPAGLAGVADSPGPGFAAVGGTAPFDVVFFDDDGALVWNYGAEVQAEGRDVAATPGGGFAALGGSIESDHAVVVKLSATGGVEWLREYPDLELRTPRAIVAQADGGLVIVGTRQPWKDATPEQDLRLARLGLGGDVLWEAGGEGPGEEGPRGLVATADGGVVVAGVQDFAFMLERFDERGESRWRRLFPGRTSSVAEDVVELPGGDLLAVGTWSTRTSGRAYVVRTGSGGGRKWEGVHIVGDASFASGVLATGGRDYLLVGGSAHDSCGMSTFLTVCTTDSNSYLAGATAG